jgi:hypothetical protein
MMVRAISYSVFEVCGGSGLGLFVVRKVTWF